MTIKYLLVLDEKREFVRIHFAGLAADTTGDITNLVGCILTDQLPFQVSLLNNQGNIHTMYCEINIVDLPRSLFLRD